MLPELKTFLIAMTPIGELRASIPIALELYKLPILAAFFWSVLGNIFPVIFILLFLEKVSNFLSRHFYFFNRFFTWLFERTRRNHHHKFICWKELALVILVAIPLPLTGAWTGSLVAFVFGVPIKKAFLAISSGVIIAGVIVTVLSAGIFWIL